MNDIPNKDASAVRRQKILRRKIITITVSVIVLAVIAYFIYGIVTRKKNILSGVVTAKVGRATILQKISASGTVDAQTGAQVNIGSQITGRIKDLYVDIGSTVKAGQIIAVLDLPDIVAQYQQATAALQVAKLGHAQQVSGVGQQQTNTRSDIKKAEAEVALAQATYNQDQQTMSAQIDAAQAAVTQAQASYQNAVTFLNREKTLLAKGYVSRQDADNAQTQADVYKAQLAAAQQNVSIVKTKTETTLQTDLATIQNAKAVLTAAQAETAQNIIKTQQVGAAQAGVQQAQANVAYWQAQYNKTIIRTPISGTITTLSTQQGETVAAGLAAPTLVTVVNLNKLQVDAFVDESDIGSLHVGQQAIVTVDAYPNKQFPGTVVKIASGGTLQQNVVTYDTTIALANPGGLLKPSMSATVSIIVGNHQNVVVVPIEAVKYAGTTPVVYVVNGEKITPHRVMTGASDDSNTEIRRGIKPGDTIVLAGYPPSNSGPRGGIFGPGGGGGGRPAGGGGGGAAGGGAGR